MLENIKRRFSLRLARFLQHYAVERDPARVIAAYRTQGIRIGNNTVIYDCEFDPVLPQLIEIGSDTVLTHAVILTHDDSAILYVGRRLVAPVKIGDRCFIGHGSLIMPGVTIGDDSIVAARAVVTKSVPPGTMVAGAPARPIGTTADYRAKLQSDPRLLDIHVTDVYTMPHEAELKRSALKRHRPDLL